MILRILLSFASGIWLIPSVQKENTLSFPCKTNCPMTWMSVEVWKILYRTPFDVLQDSDKAVNGCYVSLSGVSHYIPSPTTEVNE